jgi:hypothetical protein
VDADLLGQVFTADAVFDAEPCEAGRHEGLQAIVEWFGLGKPPHPPFHLATNFYVYEDGGQVQALSKWTIIDPDANTVLNGDYQDILVRQGHGWRISERTASFRHPREPHKIGG